MPEAIAAAGIDPDRRDRHRHRLHRLDADAGARRRHAVVRAARVPRSTARLREAVEAPRRPAAGRPDQRRRRGTRRAVAGPLRRASSRASGSTPRRCNCSRRIREIYERMDHWVEAADWIVWQLCGDYVRNACTAGYKGIWQDGAYPSADFEEALNPDFAGFAASQARPSHRRLGDARRRAHRAGGALDRAARRHRRRRRQRRRARHGAGGASRRARTDARHHGHVDLPRDEPRPAGRRARHVRRRRRRHRRRYRTATRPASPASATSSPGTSTTRCRAATSDAATRGRRVDPRAPHRPGLRRAARRARTGRARLGERQPVGARRRVAVGTDGRPDARAPEPSRATGRCSRRPRSVRA